jgi:hypothetical protein
VLARGSIRPVAIAQCDLAELEMVAEIRPFGIGGFAVFFAGSLGAALVDESAVAGDNLFRVNTGNPRSWNLRSLPWASDYIRPRKCCRAGPPGTLFKTRTGRVVAGNVRRDHRRRLPAHRWYAFHECTETDPVVAAAHDAVRSRRFRAAQADEPGDAVELSAPEDWILLAQWDIGLTGREGSARTSRSSHDVGTPRFES